jgi:hypothetical protein
MRPLAAFVMQSRLRAVSATVGFGVAGMMLPPFGLLSGASLGLVTLRLGAAPGAAVLAISAAVLTVMIGILTGNFVVGSLFGVVQWLPVLLLAQVLRSTVSWQKTLLAAGGGGWGLVLALHALVPDLAALWVELLGPLVSPMLEQTGMTTDEALAVMSEAAVLLTGMMAAALVLSFSLALIVARYWQAALYNPGGFGEEFQRLSLGRIPALALLVLLVGGWLGSQPLLMELALVGLAVFFLQGIAVVHALSRKMQMHRLWLIGLYVLMVFAPPQMMTVLAAIGAVDCFADFRARISRAGRGSGGPVE